VSNGEGGPTTREDVLLANVLGGKGKRKRERADGEHGVIMVLAMARFAAM
jgi:hypothetical protein